jgi:predicted HAD superfamily Cof-like phosphohydrolase
MSIDWVRDIHQMHEKFGAHGVDFNGKFLEFRKRFLDEELDELDKAIITKNPEEFVDALIDLCVVAIGTLDLGGVNVYTAWNAVLDANMAKQPGENPTRSGSGGFDLIKPPGWKAPSHTDNTGYFGLAINQIQYPATKDESCPSIPSHIQTLKDFQNFALSKTDDYDDEHDPEFLHATYYPNGINDIMYEIQKKVKRLRRQFKKIFSGGSGPKTDSIQDSLRDISIYSAIGHTIVEGKLEGQIENRDMFNREIIT